MKRTSLLSTTLLLAASLWGSSALAIDIILAPSDVADIVAGDTIEVDIILDNHVAVAADGTVITAFDMAVSYNDAVLTLDGIDYSTALGDPPCELLDFAPPCDMAQALFDGANIEGAGYADPNLFSLLTDLTVILALQGAGWDGVLATLMFTADAAADMVSFGLEWTGINDVKCNNARNPSDLDYVCFPQDIPEPGTMLLLSLGILGLGASRRRLRVRS